TYTVQRRGLRDGVLPYEPLIERIDSITVPSVELANRTTVPVTEAPLDPTAEWSPKNVPVVAPAPPPPPPATGPVAYPVTASPVRPQADAPKPDTASNLVRKPRVR
ncbi:MAG: hypothetical protein M3M95_02770, partial [Pseudomonadota bacterium]|nr:hypothetical protein [Pseudomonadota bacterium]